MTANIRDTTTTTAVELINSSRVGQDTFPISTFTSFMNFSIFPNTEVFSF